MTSTDAPNPSSPSGLTRGVSLGVGFAIFLIIVIAATGDFCVEVLLQGSIDGGILAAWLLAAFGFGRLILRRLGDTPTGLQAVTEIALGLGVLGLIEAGLGFAGLLSNVTSWAAIGGGLAAALYALRDRSLADIRTWLATRSPSANVAWLWAVPIAIGFVAASMAPGFLWKPLDPHPYDVLSYHLQIPREWYDAGRIIPLRHNSFSFFPMGMETHFLTAMHLRGGPWAGMYLCQFVSLAHGVLAALAVTAVCRSMRVGPVVSTLAGVATLSVPWVLMLSSVCYVESGVMLYTLLAVAWAVRAMGVLVMRETRRVDAAAEAADRTSNGTPSATESVAPAAASGPSPVLSMALAGVFAGFACGMKYTAVAMTALPLLVIWPIVAWRGIDKRRLVLAWLAAAAACAVVFSPWLIRNAVTTGNPVFPLATGVFGRGHFTPEQVDRYRTAHSPPAAESGVSARMAALARSIYGPQTGYALAALVVAAGVFVLATRQRDAAVPLLMLAATVVVWASATHLLPRFLTPAIPLGVWLIAIAARPARGWVGIILLAALLPGLLGTWSALAGALPLARQGLFRMADVTMLESDEMRAVRTSGGKIALIGDAQAFLVAVPSDRLLYRGVFDVTVPPGENLVDGWLGRSVEELRRDGYWVVIHPSELDRLSRTYAHLPKPGAPFQVAGPAPIILPPYGRSDGAGKSPRLRRGLSMICVSCRVIRDALHSSSSNTSFASTSVSPRRVLIFPLTCPSRST